jgi:TRAP-type C4-dicarboxylate transport system permease small subunit
VSKLQVLRKRIEKLFEWISVALLVLLAVEVLLGVAFRMAGRPLVWYDEVASVLLAWLTYYGAALAAIKRAHIAFPGLVNAFDPGLRLATLVVREVAVFGLFAILAFEGWRILVTLGSETLVTVDVPVWLTQSVIPVGGALFILAEALNLPDRIAWAKGKPVQPSPAADVKKEVTQ